MTVSLRFSCPSVVQNLGQPVAQQRQSLEELAREIVPSNYRAPERTTAFSRSAGVLARRDAVAGVYRARVICRKGELRDTLLRVLTWIDLLEKAPGEAISGDQLGNLLPALHEAAVRRTRTMKGRRLNRPVLEEQCFGSGSHNSCDMTLT